MLQNPPRRDPRGAEIRSAVPQSLYAPGQQVICPTGGLRELLSSPRAKNILLPFFGNMWFVLAIPPCQEGRLAIVTNVGRDAVDATERETSACGCGRRSRVVLAPRSRRQVRKTPTRRADDGVNKAIGPRGERGVSRKPLRGECRMFPVLPL